jgi:hypothetical protein
LLTILLLTILLLTILLHHPDPLSIRLSRIFRVLRKAPQRLLLRRFHLIMQIPILVRHQTPRPR